MNGMRDSGAIRVAAVAGTASPWRDRVRLGLVGLGIAAVPLDSAVNIAFPDITGSFGLPLAMIQWVVICYVLTHAGLMLAFGRVGDIWGHARVFRAGLAWNAAAFLLCAAAPSYGWLLFFRFLQGIGAGLIISCAPALVTSLYPEARRSHALGMFTLMFAIGSAAGPIIGGLLVARWGWPAVFWFRAPIALIALLFLRGLPPQLASGGRERFDIGGAALLAVGLASLLLAINTMPRLGGGNYLGPALLIAAAALLGGFVRWERRAARPIVRIELFAKPGFAAINFGNTLLMLTTFSVLLFVPYFFARFTDLPLPVAGGVLAVGFVAMAMASPVASRLTGRFGAERVAALGAIVTGAGLALVGFWQPGIGAAAMAAVLALHGIGLGLFQVAYMDLVMATAALADRGVAGSLSMLTRTVGIVTGAALLTVGFQTIQQNAAAAGASAPDAFLAAFHLMFWLAGGVAALIGIAVTGRRRLRG